MISSLRAKHRDISNGIKTMGQIPHPLIVGTKVATPRKTLIIKFLPTGRQRCQVPGKCPPGEMLKLHKNIPTQRFSLINSFTSKIRNKSTNLVFSCKMLQNDPIVSNDFLHSLIKLDSRFNKSGISGFKPAPFVCNLFALTAEPDG